ncbi:SDR family NAD(P)-dependent oxidoreductase [Entomobacter blattae]|uniref:3-phenylpropionate-dihydrodiol/cinnamic acid-dihydrodiol dehydrogenase n=1 Tax=Entomobacter blattae TaxID=2762277 RepID=A0A7H1NQM4_9PROT|nr:SDR family oxidoreductase [Entomobacter blattae]QNT78084.1 3-phenylpropionate-dihydrodiol/cinnamic acid-dihydrodiol dehydrogenase [Entomobacter blattae]
MTSVFNKTPKTHPKKAVLSGATGGVGHALVPLLIAEGYHVGLIGRNPQKLEALHAQFPEQTSLFLQDLAEKEAASRLVTAITSQWGHISLLINNAGTITPGPAETLTAEEHDRQINVNFTTPLQLTQAFLPHIAPKGKILFINSIGGIMPLKGSAAYSATKFGLRGYALSLAQEMQARQIRVSSIFPGAIDTDMLFKEAQEGGTPLNFLAAPLTPEQVALLVLKALRQGKLEYYIPTLDGIGARLALSFPALVPPLMPFLEYWGKRGMKKYMRKMRTIRPPQA